MSVICPYCSNEAELIRGTELYPGRGYLAKRYFWRCDPCDAHVGTHENSERHAPLGRLANGELRAARVKLHLMFDRKWKQPNMSRSRAYEWLADKLGLEKSHCHIGHFDLELCKRALVVLDWDL
jgi:hypothetical protein